MQQREATRLAPCEWLARLDSPRLSLTDPEPLVLFLGQVPTRQLSCKRNQVLLTFLPTTGPVRLFHNSSLNKSVHISLSLSLSLSASRAPTHQRQHPSSRIKVGSRPASFAVIIAAVATPSALPSVLSVTAWKPAEG